MSFSGSSISSHSMQGQVAPLYNSALSSHHLFSAISHFNFQDRKTGVYSGVFISPNELNTHLWFPRVKTMDDGGLMISVGSVRGLMLLGQSKCDAALLVDMDGAVIEFNRALFRLIVGLDDEKIPTSEKRELLYSLISGNRVTTHNQPSVKQHIKCFTSALDSIEKTYSKLWSSLTTGFACMNMAVMSDRSSESPEQQFLWENDAIWDKIAGMLKEGKLATVQVDILEDSFLDQLISFSSTTNIPIRLLDLSNIPGDLGYERRQQPEEQKLRQLIDHGLFAAADLLFTEDRGFGNKRVLASDHPKIESHHPSSRLETWNYCALKCSDYGESIPNIEKNRI